MSYSHFIFYLIISLNITSPTIGASLPPSTSDQCPYFTLALKIPSRKSSSSDKKYINLPAPPPLPAPTLRGLSNTKNICPRFVPAPGADVPPLQATAGPREPSSSATLLILSSNFHPSTFTSATFPPPFVGLCHRHLNKHSTTLLYLGVLQSTSL